jgi:ribonuclease VapC
VTIFLDASAVVAMIAREPEAETFGSHLGPETDRIISPLSVWESVRGVQSTRGVALEEARDLVSDFLDTARIRVVSIEPEDADLALDAHARFGKGVHPAALNFGDCFAYAVTRRYKAELMFKGNDFAQTDITDATLP